MGLSWLQWCAIKPGMEVEHDLNESYRQRASCATGQRTMSHLKQMAFAASAAFNKKILMTFCCVQTSIDNQCHPQNSPQRFVAAILFLCLLTLVTILCYCSNSISTLSKLRPITLQILSLDIGLSPAEMGQTSRIKSNLERLAMNLISEMKQISSPSSCENRTLLYCGYKSKCGLGCQLHHHATCLMLSYTMKIPLIHDTRGWPFGKWENVFQPLGSQCSTNERTITVKWSHSKLPVLSLNKSSKKVIKYPFKSGIPVDPDFLREVQHGHPEPFLWFVGQFLKYTMRLSSKFSPVVNDFLSQLPKNSPMVGLHIRRTDKVKLNRGAYHKIQDYMIPAQAYFQKFNRSLNRTVYLASDDHKLLTQAQKLYTLPQWRFMGLKINKTYYNEKSRLNSPALVSVIKDVEALAKCDYVICGFSSNICRLILELITADHIDGFQRVKSLDWQYPFRLAGHIVPRRLIPTSSSRYE